MTPKRLAASRNPSHILNVQRIPTATSAPKVASSALLRSRHGHPPTHSDLVTRLFAEQSGDENGDVEAQASFVFGDHSIHLGLENDHQSAKGEPPVFVHLLDDLEVVVVTTDRLRKCQVVAVGHPNDELLEADRYGLEPQLGVVRNLCDAGGRERYPL